MSAIKLKQEILSDTTQEKCLQDREFWWLVFTRGGPPVPVGLGRVVTSITAFVRVFSELGLRSQFVPLACRLPS